MSVQTREGIRVISCTECERPWGAILPRAHDDTDVLRATLELQNALRTWWSDQWKEITGGARWGPPDEIPEPTLTSIVFVSEATLRWFDEMSIECAVEGGTWNEVDSSDLPAWWVNRRRRFAMRWNCCDLK